MPPESDLTQLLKSLEPRLHPGEYVFCSVSDPGQLDREDILCSFREKEGYSLVLQKETADRSGLPYTYIARWIMLSVHSALEAVGLTAAVSGALAAKGISCNLVAAFHHDHIFVAQKDAETAVEILGQLARSV